MSGVVYTLQVENGCYYIGWSSSWDKLGYRLNSHFTGQGAAWTKLHPPQRLIEAFPGDKNLERETTLRLAKTYGWEKTRGAAWCQVNLKCSPGQLDSYTTVLVKSKQRHISHWISEAKDSISRADHHLSSLMDTVLTEGPPAEDPGQSPEMEEHEEDPVLPRDYDASVP